MDSVAPALPPGRTRVAVIGSGCGAMTAVWGLLQSDRANDFDITVYQYGWRCGGKGASGRNAEYGQRIEEHGLHIWTGMYENAFAVMRSCYEQAGRPPGSPLSVCFDPRQPQASAFLPHNLVSLAEYVDQRWKTWNLEFPATDGVPGNGRLLPPLIDYVEMILEGLIEVVFGVDFLASVESWLPPFRTWGCKRPPRSAHPGAEAGFAAAEAFLKQGARTELRRALAAYKALRPSIEQAQVSFASSAAGEVAAGVSHVATSLIDAVLFPLQHVLSWARKWLYAFLDQHDELRRAFYIAELGIVIATGMLRDGILWKGFMAVDGDEFTDWLRRHGASDFVIQSPLIRGWHAFAFAYRDGQPAFPSIAASTALVTLLRCVLTYKGAFFWRMQAGMGDTVFAPMYEVMRRRGVRFEFFHRVEHIGVQTDGDERWVDSLRVARQVDLRDPTQPYEPLIDVKGVPSWPSEPRWEQLDPSQAAALKAGDVNLESWWTDWSPREVRTLRRGVDFDLVILGIPPAAIRPIGEELRCHAPFAAMLDSIESNQTCAAQLWLDVPLRDLGWNHGETVGTVYANPHNTWANMDQLLPREDWPEGAEPKTVLYLCGTMSDAVPIPPAPNPAFAAGQEQRIYDVSVAWLQSNMGNVFPKATLPGSPDLDWSLLTCAHGDPQGEHRMAQQFWRLNIDPSERYVLSVPGSGLRRLRADESGFANLYLAGDWLRTGLNAGCVEAAVMGGLQASRAIAGWPQRIVGDEHPGDPNGVR